MSRRRAHRRSRDRPPAPGHRDGHGAIEFHDRRRRHAAEHLVELHDARPVRVARRRRARVAGRNRRLQRVRTTGIAQTFGTVERGQSAADEQPVPPGAILIEQHDRLARGIDARLRTRRLDFQQRHETVDFRLGWRQLGENPAETQRVLGKRRPHPVVARRCRIAFVEDQIDHFEHRRQSRRALARPAEFRTARARRPACAWRGRCAARWSAQARGRRARCLRCVRPPSRRSVSATRASVESTGWQAVNTRRSRSSPMSSSSAASRSGMAASCWAWRSWPSASCLRSKPLGPAEVIDGAMLRRGHQPGARVVRNA